MESRSGVFLAWRTDETDAMACRTAWRQERRSAAARGCCNAANSRLLYSTCSRITCCLTRFSHYLLFDPE